MTPERARAVHAALESLALLGGSRLYFALRRREGGSALDGPRLAVVLGCLLGAALGNKAAFWLERPDLFLQAGLSPRLLQGGQSLVGGLLGGLLGVELAKALAGVKRSTGDAFVFPVLLGIAIGRVGCFLGGLEDGTAGVPTGSALGVDFGDGVRRHPTQLYEIVWALAMAALLHRLGPRLARAPGLRFKLLLVGYLAWRLAIDALKPVAVAYPGGLSGIQVLCLVALALYLPLVARQARRLAEELPA